MKFLDETGLAQVWAKIKSIVPTKTSDLINDGDGGSPADPFVQESDLATVATTGSYNDLEDTPTIPDPQVAADWDKDGDDYADGVKNRTHYKQFSNNQNYTNDDPITFSLVDNHAYGQCYGFGEYPASFIDKMVEGNYISLTIGGTKFEGEWKQSGSMFWIGNRSIRTPDAEDTGEDFYIGTNSKGFDNLHMYLDPSFVGEYQADDLVFEAVEISYVQLDEKYIPSTIARTSDIPITDQTYNNLSQNPQSGTAVAGAIANVTSLIPTKTSDLTNDGVGGSPADPFITKTVDNLTNYYDKSDIDDMISVRLKIQVVDTLPIQDIDTSTIYLVPEAGSPSEDNVYEEYIYIIDEEASPIEGHWEMIGTSEVDLSDYMQKSNNLNDVADRQTALNNLTGAGIAQVGKYLKVDNIGNVTFGTVAAQSQADWNQGDNTQVDYIKNKPNLATVATSGDYSDLSNAPLSSIAITQSETSESQGNKKYYTTTITIDGVNTAINVPFVDSALSTTSFNPVQNKVLNNALSSKLEASRFDTLDAIALTKLGMKGGTTFNPIMTISDGEQYPTVGTGSYSTRWKMGHANDPTCYKIYDISQLQTFHLTTSSRAGYILTNTDPSTFATKVRSTGTSTWYEATNAEDSEQPHCEPKDGWHAYDLDITNGGKSYLIVYEVNAHQSVVVSSSNAYYPIPTSLFTNDGEGGTPVDPFAKVSEIPTKTSDLINDGEGGSPARFIEEDELEATQTDIDDIFA